MIIRAIGRRLSESSPVSTVKNDCPASSPLSRRIVVPEFPASSTSSGSFRPYSPFPFTNTLPSGSNSTDTPNARMHETVDRQSSAAKKLCTSTGVSANPASMILRCDSDLSPGTATVPDNRPAFSIPNAAAISNPLLHCYNATILSSQLTKLFIFARFASIPANGSLQLQSIAAISL